MSTPIDLEELERLLESATPGPWNHNAPIDPDDWGVFGAGDFVVFDGGQRIEDAELTAALRNAAPALLEAVRAAQKFARLYMTNRRPDILELDDALAPFRSPVSKESE